MALQAGRLSPLLYADSGQIARTAVMHFISAHQIDVEGVEGKVLRG